MKHVIKAEHLKKYYTTVAGTVKSLDDVSFAIDEGEMVAIIGQSGSGKSTLMNLLGCLDRPTDGRYLFDGQDTARMTDKQLSTIRNRQIGFVFQSFHLLGELSAVENVELPLYYRGIGKAERRRLATESLRRVGLSDRIQHRPCEMSGGQQQRVAIARAICSRPPLILADEPTGNLDRRSTAEVMALLTELNRDGMTVVLITHDTEIAAACPRRLTISDGRLIADTAQEVDRCRQAAP